MSDQLQYIRKAGLFVLKQSTGVGLGADGLGDPSLPTYYDSRVTTVLPKTLDLSEMRFQFKTSNWDEEGPSNCVVRVFNLKPETVQEIIRFNYTQVVVQAGYGAAYGVVFKGDIKQFRVGKLDQKDSYLDILAADGDLAYNFAVTNASLSAEQNNSSGVKKAINDAVQQYGVTMGDLGDANSTGGIVEGLRGKVLFGMARVHIANLADTLGATWSIQDGKVVITPLDGIDPGEAVVLTSATGLIGIPEQTQSGIIARCLINPKLKIGTNVRIDNRSINQSLGQDNVPGFQVPFNQWAGVQNFASVATDGLYRVYGCELEGDTRGAAWYATLTCLAIDGTTKNVRPYG